MPDPQATPVATATPSLPSLTPESPYKPLELPQVAPPKILSEGLPQQEPIPELGAVSKAGAIAYMANNVLRSAAQGYDAARLHHAEQFNKKMAALSSLDQSLGQQYQEAYNEVGSSKLNPDGTPLSPQQILEDPRVKQLHNQLVAVHQSTLQTIQGYLPPLQTDKKTGKTKEKRNILERMFGQEPDEALRAYAEAAQQLGPSAFYQVASPQQLKAMYDQRQGAGITQQADTAAATAKRDLAQAEVDYAAALKTGDQAKIDAALNRVDALKTAESPERTPAYANITDGQGHIQTIDKTREAIPPGWHLAGTASANPKPWRYNTATDTVASPDGQVYSPSDPNLPPEAKALLEGARRALAGKSSTTTGEHTIMVWNGTQQVPVQVQTTSTHGAAGLPSLGGGEQPTTHATPAHPAGSATLHSSAAPATPATHPSAPRSNAGVVSEGTPVGWKFSPQTVDLTKKADAAAAAQTAVTQEFQAARQQLADILRDPRNGAAQMALVASYLKNVIGAHSAAQQGAQVRLTNVEWQMALNSQPWLEQYAKHVQGGVVLSGVVLSPAQARNFVGQIGEQAIKAKQTAAELKKQAEASVEKDKGGVGAQPAVGGFDWNAHPVAQ